MANDGPEIVDDRHGDWRPGVAHVRTTVTGRGGNPLRFVGQHRLTLGVDPDEPETMDPLRFVQSIRNPPPDFPVTGIVFRDHGPSGPHTVHIGVERDGKPISYREIVVDAPDPRSAMLAAPAPMAMKRNPDAPKNGSYVRVDVAEHLARCPMLAVGPDGAEVRHPERFGPVDDMPETLRDAFDRLEDAARAGPTP